MANARSDRGHTTRQNILGIATGLFTEHGYEAVSIEAVLLACGISRGALYHHFASKEALFTAALEAAEERVAAHVQAAAQTATDPLDALRLGCRAWLDLAASDATVRRLVLTDAPSVIGWQAWREMDSRHSLGLLKGALALGAQAGRLRADRIDLYAHMLLAVLVEVALVIARAPDDQNAVSAGQDAVEQLLSSLSGAGHEGPR